MAPGQIHNMDVVTHTGAVRGGVIVAKDVHLFQLAPVSYTHLEFSNALGSFTQQQLAAYMQFTEAREQLNEYEKQLSDCLLYTSRCV